MQIPNIMYKIRDGLIVITFISFILLGLSLLFSGCNVDKSEYNEQRINSQLERVEINNQVYYIYEDSRGDQVISYTKDSLEIELMKEKLDYYQKFEAKYVN